MWINVWYHYLISKDWTIVQTRCLDKVWNHNIQNNSHSIWISLIWKMNEHKPSKEQYEALNLLLIILKSQFTWAAVKWHRWRWASCPWKLFDQSLIWEYKKTSKPVVSSSITWVYNITRYYSPVQWQDHYFMWKTYSQDVTTNCWYSAIWNNNCMYPAKWWILTAEDAWRVVACWQQFPAYTKFKIRWYWRVTCRDRWWAIAWKRLDLRVWYWMTWLNVIENTKRPAWDVVIEEVLPPK